MKKSLLALAVLGAFAGAASAQTNVTIYGVVDAAIERSDTNTTSASWSMTDGNSANNKNGSRLGFKGSEDLGGGLSAIFTLENGFNIDTGAMRADGIFSRQAWVGLQGGFGTVKFGRQYTPMFLALDAIDPFGTGMTGAINNLFNANGTRSNNTINYSLSAAGLTGQLAYNLGEVAGDNSANRGIGLSLNYANGPIGAVFAYHNTNDNPADATSLETKTALLGGTYNFGVAKLHAGFQSNEQDGVTGAAVVDDKNWMLGVSAPVGAGTVLASYVRRDADLVTAARGDADRYALGYVHNLSKRTNVYTSYARQNDKSTANVDTNLFNVGLQHRF